MAPTMSDSDDGRRIEIDNHDADGRPASGPVVAVEIDSDALTLIRETHDPYDSPRCIACDRATKTINQYALAETSGRSRSGSASSLNHHDRLLVLVRDGDSWTVYNPQAGAVPRDDDSDYIPTQVGGISVKTAYRTRGGPGSESRYKRRYKFERELLESHDEVWLIEYLHEQGGSRGGGYNRDKNATATRLEGEN